MGPWRDLIRKWLEGDWHAPRKQRHTAQRVDERLWDEYGPSSEWGYRQIHAALRRDGVVISEVVDGMSYQQHWTFSLVESEGAWHISKWVIRDEPPESAPPGTYQIVLTGQILDSHHRPLQGRIEAWQVYAYNAIAGKANYWNIPGWVMPVTRTDEDGRFDLLLRDYPKLQYHQYYIIVVVVDEPGYKHFGMYITMTEHEDSAVVDLSQIVIVEVS